MLQNSVTNLFRHGRHTQKTFVKKINFNSSKYFLNNGVIMLTFHTDESCAVETKSSTELPWVRNTVHKKSLECENEPRVIRTSGFPLSIPKPKELHELCEPKGYLRKNNLGDILGTRSYILQGFLAELEHALINYTTEFLKNEGFNLILVPDFLSSHVIESCGFPVKSERNMVYEIETPEGSDPIYLSGTSEMGIAACLSNKVFNKTELPLKYVAVSRCFRAETSHIEEERGIYRVHNFSKVEMFGVTSNENNDGSESEEFHEYLVQIQENLFKQLGLHYQILEMPPNELGFPAHRKLDIEAWMPGRKQFGEISSASNCTDYQARRLNICYRNHESDSKEVKFVHTLNGTACAIPRMLIAIIESNQDDKGYVTLPSILQKYMHSEWDSKLKNVTKNTLFMKNRTQQQRVFLRYDPWRSGESHNKKTK